MKDKSYMELPKFHSMVPNKDLQLTKAILPLAKNLIDFVKEYCDDNYDENEDNPMRDAYLKLNAAIEKLEKGKG